MPLLAEGGETGTAVLVVFAGIVGGAATWAAKTIRDIYSTRRTNRVEDDTRNRERADELYERAKADSEQARRNEQQAQARASSLTNQIVEVKLLAVAKSEHIKYLEGLLTDHQVAFRRWTVPAEDRQRSEQETEAGE